MKDTSKNLILLPASQLVVSSSPSLVLPGDDDFSRPNPTEFATKSATKLAFATVPAMKTGPVASLMLAGIVKRINEAVQADRQRQQDQLDHDLARAD